MEKDCKKYVDNEVFEFRCELKCDFTDEDIIVYTKPLSNVALVQEKYFTKEMIDQLKQKFIQRIQDCENPFDIFCVDRDGGYYVTEDMLFDVEK